MMRLLLLAAAKLTGRFLMIWLGVIWAAALDMTIIGVSGMVLICTMLLDGLVLLSKMGES